MLLRLLAWLPFPGLVVLLILAEWRSAGPTGIALGPLLLGPALIVYLLALPFLYRGLRPLSTRRVALFSTLAAVLWLVFTVAAFVLISGPAWHESPYLSDLLFFWFLPVGPAILAIWVGYRWAMREAGARP